MAKIKIIVFFFLVSFSVKSQSNLKKFCQLPSAKKTWVVLHLFKAKRALKISEEARKISDSISKTNILDGDGSGGQVDAFRHGFWMARLHQELGRKAALSLGKAHEKDNYRAFKKGNLEEGNVPDEIASIMDLYNNTQGISLTTKGSTISKKGLVYRVVNAVKAGQMKIIKKDKKGNYLTCEGKRIPKESLQGKWKNNKCLVSSNQFF